jgi:hypothetical protein
MLDLRISLYSVYNVESEKTLFRSWGKEQSRALGLSNNVRRRRKKIVT